MSQVDVMSDCEMSTSDNSHPTEECLYERTNFSAVDPMAVQGYLVSFCMTSICLAVVGMIYLVFRLYFQWKELRREEAVWELVEGVAHMIVEEMEEEIMLLRGEGLEFGNDVDFLDNENEGGVVPLIRRLLSTRIIATVRGPGR